MAFAEVKPAERACDKGLFSRFRRERDGATAVEFAIVILPFLLVVFATFETFIAYTAEQLVNTAVDDLSRKVRTGAITFNTGKASDMTEAEFRGAFCEEVSILIKCSATEPDSPQKLYIDFHSVASFSDIKTEIPRVDPDNSYSDIDTSAMTYAPGNAGALNSLRVYYRWEVMTDIVRPLIANVIPSGQASPSEFLIVSTTAFRNENYPL